MITTFSGNEGADLETRNPHGSSYASALDSLVQHKVASRLFGRDATLWGADAEAEAAQRLGWVDLASRATSVATAAREHASTLHARGINRVVLCGMGGSSLAPEVICESTGRELVVLDSSHPDMVAEVVAQDLSHTVVVIASKSGGTVETDSHRRIFVQAFTDAGLVPAEHIVVITDPGSPFDVAAQEAGYTVFRADPEVGGRYSALSAFGIVPSALAGVDVDALLAQALAVSTAFASDSPDNPVLRLGALMGEAVRSGVDKLVLAPSDSDAPTLGVWIEQLVAESTGKHGTGLLPVVVGSPAAAGFAESTPDGLLVSFGDLVPDVPALSGWSAHVRASLGAQFLLWEAATAVASHLLEINPFDQPDVESAKLAARSMLDGDVERRSPSFVVDEVEVFTSPDLLPNSTRTVEAAVETLYSLVREPRDYLAIQVYSDRLRDHRFEEVRERLAVKLGRPVTFGWGPRFLHSTGQYHKGGPATGVYLQITVAPQGDVQVPGRPFTLGEFIDAQAQGDAEVLATRGRPVLRLHVNGPFALRDLMEALV
ncbi:glucose-6-phosphate isomerase [Nocardioides yefusunii]|uniref:Glucose-6-phosphate isomerase n=1 Tax=Nocardioides yefusunii TaxID=2500546 RepID=A0ABW1R2A8_9ACTN|nr:glucose-6-phosphate isomerase [Nocardioides yefusunii]